MILTPVILSAAIFLVADGATTVTMPPPTTTMAAATTAAPAVTTAAMAAKILYDQKHHKAMIVRSDGCYEYHMTHQDVMDSQNDATRAVLEARMLSELANAVNIQESGHHHIDHMTQEIKTACASVPVYNFEIA